MIDGLERQLAEARAETRELAEKGYEASVWAWSKEHNRLADQLLKYKTWLHRFVDHEDQPCTLDHHGYCQEHPGADETCAVAEVRAAILGEKGA